MKNQKAETGEQVILTSLAWLGSWIGGKDKVQSDEPAFLNCEFTLKSPQEL